MDTRRACSLARRNDGAWQQIVAHEGGLHDRRDFEGDASTKGEMNGRLKIGGGGT